MSEITPEDLMSEMKEIKEGMKKAGQTSSPEEDKPEHITADQIRKDLDCPDCRKEYESVFGPDVLEELEEDDEDED